MKHLRAKLMGESSRLVLMERWKAMRMIIQPKGQAPRMIKVNV